MPDPPDDADDEIRIAPAEPLPPVEPPEIHLPPEEPYRDPEQHQFTVAEMLGLTAVLAVLLSVLASVAKWTQWGTSPGNLAKLFATGLGFGSLLSAVALAFVPQARRIVVVGWWVLLGSYIVTAAAAMLMSK